MASRERALCGQFSWWCPLGKLSKRSRVGVKELITVTYVPLCHTRQLGVMAYIPRTNNSIVLLGKARNRPAMSWLNKVTESRKMPEDKGERQRKISSAESQAMWRVPRKGGNAEYTRIFGEKTVWIQVLLYLYAGYVIFWGVTICKL